MYEAAQLGLIFATAVAGVAVLMAINRWIEKSDWWWDDWWL